MPYTGRGTAPVVRLRMPPPIATHRRHGEVHSDKAWAAQANRYRELARAREEHRQHYGDLLVANIAANPEGEGRYLGPEGSEDSLGKGYPGRHRDVGPGGQGSVGGGEPEGVSCQKKGLGRLGGDFMEEVPKQGLRVVQHRKASSHPLRDRCPRELDP